MTQISILNPNKLPTIDYRKIQPLQGNLKDLTRENYDKLKNVLIEDGFDVPFFIWHNTTNNTHYALDGHQRKRVMTGENMNDNGSFEVPYVLFEAANEHDARRKLLRITSQYGTITYEGYDEFTVEMQAFDGFDFDTSLANLHFDALPLLGTDKQEDEDDKDRAGNMIKDFGVPPFSVLDTRQGYWQDRKDEWLKLGIKSEVGRADGLMIKSTGFMGDAIKKRGGGTSVFDPVLCELMYSWFNVPKGTVLDPFAGGSVRGVIASALGQQYVGVELRNEQVEANRDQGQTICSDPMPVWITGDSTELDTLVGDDIVPDLIFSCPPYADLEVYSDDPKDLSNMPYNQFIDLYSEIIKKACDKLKDNRFAIFVVGEVRDKAGEYYNFVGDTVQAFLDAGLIYYNELILVNNAGTLPLRAGRQFNNGRKIGKMHQNVLVFYKGDPKAIKSNYPELKFDEPPKQPDDLFDPNLVDNSANLQ